MLTEISNNKEDAPQEEHKTDYSESYSSIGLSIEDIQHIIAEKTGYHIPKDDPIIAIVAILNAFIEENKKLQSAHIQALQKLFKDMSQEVNIEIQNTTEEIQHALKTISIEGLIKINKEHTRQITQLNVHLFYACIFIGIATIFNLLILL